MKVWKEDRGNFSFVRFDEAEGCLRWMNFTGAKGTYNQEGQRNFKVEISEDMKEFFEQEGIHVGTWVPKPSDYDEEPEPVYTVNINVGFDNQYFPIQVWLLDPINKTKISVSGDQAFLLDHMTYSKVSLKCREYRSSKRPGHTTLYLDKAYFTKDVDDLDNEYSEYKDGTSIPDPLKESNSGEDEIPFV